MANEFKIKNALLIEGSTNSQRVIAVRNASTEITADASSILLTGKAIYDYVNSQSGVSTLAALTDVLLTDLSDNQLLRYDYASGKWINISPFADSQVNSNVVYYDTTTGELTYGAAPGGTDLSTLDIGSYVNSSSYYDSSLNDRTNKFLPNPSTLYGDGNGHYDGQFVNITAGETINSWYCIGGSTNSYGWCLAKADASNHVPAWAINPSTNNASTLGTQTYQFMTQGLISHGSFSWTPGKQIYLTTSGGLSQTAPSSAGQVVQVIGIALTAKTFYFKPSMDFVVLK